MNADSKQDVIQFRFWGGTGTFRAGASLWLFGLCLVVSLPFLWVYLVVAPWQWWQARTWAETPCTILTAELVPDGATRSLQARVTYEYHWQDQLHRSDRQRILNYSYRRHREANEAELRSRYPPGIETRCFVNPQAPREALLDRELTPGDFLYLPFVVLIAGVGVAGLIVRWSRWRRV